MKDSPKIYEHIERSVHEFIAANEKSYLKWFSPVRFFDNNANMKQLIRNISNNFREADCKKHSVYFPALFY